jgi:hypothetical protein
MEWILNGKLRQLENYVNPYNMINRKFEIDYSNFNPDKEYEIKNEKVSKSNARIIADAETAIRNSTPEHGKKVSVGLKKHFLQTLGNVEERFLNNIIKKKTDCWEFKHRWFYDENGQELQPKQFSAIYYKLNFTKECIIQTCNNPKCVNPKHLSEIDRIEQAQIMRNNRPELSRDNGYGKLSNDDVSTIKNMYLKMLDKTDGKHRGIANEIHKNYPNVSLGTIVGIVKKIKPKHLIDETPILMYEYNDNTNSKGKFLKKYPNIASAVFDKKREVQTLIKKYIIKILEGKMDRTGHGKSRKGGYVFEYEK